MKLVYYLFTLIFLTSCQKRQHKEIEKPSVIEILTSFSQACDNVNQRCAVSSKSDFSPEKNNCEKPNQKASRKGGMDYLNCLITARLKSKTKSELLNDIKHTGITSKSNLGGYNQGYISFAALMKISNLEDYRKMLRDDCPSVRYYGYMAICMDYPNAVYGELKNLIQDSTVVPTHFGCLVDVTTLSELYYKTVTVKYRRIGNGRQYDTYQLSEQEKNSIDRVRPKYKIVFNDK